MSKSTDPVVIVWPMYQFEKDYQTFEKIGEGHYGKVYSARRKEASSKKIKEQRNNGKEDLDDKFAAKFISCEGASARLRVREEIDILFSLHHPNILRLFAAYEEENESTTEIVQILEYLSGGQLFEKIIESPYNIGEFEIREYVRQICTGCSYLATNNIVHLDLKPENIVCTDILDGNINRLKLVDFGFARRLSDNQETRVMTGTPQFVSPEVIKYEPVTLATDMWSLGVITYVLLSGLSPFLGEENQETFKNVLSGNYSFDEEEFEEITKEAKDFIAKMLILDQSKRMHAAAALYHPWMLGRKAIAEAEFESLPPNERSRKFENQLVFERVFEKQSSLKRKERLKKVVAKLRWQKCINTAQACARFNNTTSGGSK